MVLTGRSRLKNPLFERSYLSISMHVLLTGGAGFIGSHLAEKLLENGHQVSCVDNFDDFYPRSIKEQNIAGALKHPAYTLHEVDIRDFEALKAVWLKKVDVIVHLAAKAGVRPSIQDPVSYQEVNVTGTQHLLELAREYGIQQFIFASSSSVYGKNPHVPWKEADAVLQPISPYASTKVSGELLGHVYSHLYDIRFLAMRFFTVYGPRQRPDLAIHKFLKRMYEGKAIQQYGDGSTRRDYTYIEDIVSGLMAAIHYEDSMYEIFNLGNNQTVTLKELIEAIEVASGIKAKIEYAPEQPGDVRQTWADVEKSHQLLGYQAKIHLSAGLQEFSNWFFKQHL